MVILAYADEAEYIESRNIWVVCHISKLKIKITIFTGPTRKAPPKPRLMTMEEMDCDQEPNEYDGDCENK